MTRLQSQQFLVQTDLYRFVRPSVITVSWLNLNSLEHLSLSCYAKKIFFSHLSVQVINVGQVIFVLDFGRAFATTAVTATQETAAETAACSKEGEAAS